jgi:hypothetical protein
MRQSCVLSLKVTLALTLTVVISGQVSPAAQSGNGERTAAAKPIPRTPDGRPDFTGVWWPGRDITPATSSAVYREGERTGIGPRSFGSLYKPEFAEKAKALSDKDDPALWCIPSIFGPTPLVGNGLVGEIVQTPKVMIQLVETYHGFRVIPTDGRPHRDDVVPSNRGDAVGRWEGDTLVVDVTSFNDQTWFDRAGNFHSDALHVVERYTPIAPNVIDYEVTIEDPNVFSRPWKMRMPLYRRLEQNAQLQEYNCVEFTEELLYGHLAKQPSK